MGLCSDGGGSGLACGVGCARRELPAGGAGMVDAGGSGAAASEATAGSGAGAEELEACSTEGAGSGAAAAEVEAPAEEARRWRLGGWLCTDGKG
eukprot:6189611-Pleurochrysis_carterae.AAC.1